MLIALRPGLRSSVTAIGSQKKNALNQGRTFLTWAITRENELEGRVPSCDGRQPLVFEDNRRSYNYEQRVIDEH